MNLKPKETHFMFPIVVEKTNGGVGMYFPNFPGTAILSSDIINGIKQAKEMLAFRIIELEEQDLPVPNPSNPESIELHEPSDQIIYIDVYMPPYRNEAENKAVTKNCTLPKWLRDAGEEAGLNFSHILQAAIKEALNIHSPRGK